MNRQTHRGKMPGALTHGLFIRVGYVGRRGDGRTDLTDITVSTVLTLLLAVSAQAVPPPFDEGVTYSVTRYVSPSGSDPSGNGSLTSPYASVGRALQGAAPGLRVVMLPGTYGVQGSFSNLQGTAQQPIAIVGQGTAIINAAGASVGMAFQDPRYLVLENLTVQNSAGHGMNIDDAGSLATPGQFVVIRNVRFLAIGSGGNNDCLKMSGIDQFYVVGSEFAGCNIGEAIDMVGCHDGIITNNYFHDMPGTGVQAKGGSRNVLIHGNRFRNIASHAINLGGSTGDPFIRPPGAPNEGERIQAMSNLIENSGQAPVAFLGCYECVAANNTIVTPGRWFARVLQGSRDTSIVRSRNGHFVNNIVYYDSTLLGDTVNVGPETDPQTFTFGNNLYYATHGVAFNGVHGDVPNEVNSVLQQNPLFVDVNHGDLHVAVNSPALRRGRTLPYSIALFHHGNVTPDSPPDIGAYRISGGTTPPPPPPPPPPSGSPCDVDASGSTTVVDVQLCVNQVVGVLGCTTGDIDLNGSCNVVDVQRVVNAALGGACATTP